MKKSVALHGLYQNISTLHFPPPLDAVTRYREPLLQVVSSHARVMGGGGGVGGLERITFVFAEASLP